MRSCGFSSNPHENVATTHLPFKRGPQKKYLDENTKAQITNIQLGEKPNKHHQNAINTKPDQLNFTSRSPNLQI